MKEAIASIPASYAVGQKGVLLEALRRIQEAEGYISREAVEALAARLTLAPAQIYGTLTFYSELRTQPSTKTDIGLCLGPTCHLRGAHRIKRALEGLLEGKYAALKDEVSIHVEQCPGICHQAPTLRLNGVLHDHVRVTDLDGILEGLLKQD